MTITEQIIAILSQLTPEEKQLPLGTYSSGEIYDPHIDLFNRKVNVAIVSKDGQQLLFLGNFVTDFDYTCGYKIEKILL